MAIGEHSLFGMLALDMPDFTTRPFAFMRLTHEALRSGFVELKDASTARDLDRAREAWTSLAGIVDVHKRHEEERFFPLLDELFDGAVTAAGLRDAHEREHRHEATVHAALEAGDLAALDAALQEWAPSFEQHLADEEDVMMPLTVKVAATLEGRAAAVRTILDVDWDGLVNVHLPTVTRALGETKPYGPVRMFVSSVQLAAGDRYAELEPIIRAALPEATVQTLEGHGHLTAG